ncbi:MAG TPA: DUF4835 family protein [Chitinophagaceae bacterium]|nr:DUF4835 family protein [Chitinophagaceae bacterium]
MKKTILFIIIMSSALATLAQELNCKVMVNADQIQGIDQKIFKTLEQSLTEFVNTRKWGNDNFDPKERIECVFSLLLNKPIEGVEGGYTGRLSIQATRTIYNTSYSTNLVNYVDKDIAINYLQYQTIEFNANRVSGNDALASNLPALIAYYCYIIIGLDYDSFSLKGGTDFYTNALNIVNNAPEGKGITGWKAAENQKNRFWLSEQLTNNRFAGMRDVFYKYHRLGLDLLTIDNESARSTINETIPILSKINTENPNSILMQFFMNAKSEELLNLMANATSTDKQKLVPMLSSLDVSNANKYAELLK